MDIKFGAHNILFPNGQQTLPRVKILLSERPVMKVIKRSIDNFITKIPEERKKLKIVDLGCMEGGYSAEFARMGFNTLGIDARKQNLLKAMYVKFNLNLPNLNFVKDDARNVAKYGKFDITFCFGLIYHLDNPVQFLKTLGQQTNKMLILHTFYSPEEDLGYKLEYKVNSIFPELFSRRLKRFSLKEVVKDEHTSYLQHIKNYRLSPDLSENEGYRGRWFKEWNENKKREKIEKMPGASYNNHRSFWLCKSDLIKSLYDSGFDSVYEQHDDIGDLTSDNPDDYYPRVLLIAIKN